MPSPGPEVLRLASIYRFGLAYVPRSGAAGERLGRGVGSSIEFMDRRRYEPGDDVRHIDWRALARTDQLMVRQYREETQPRIDLVVDASRSMATDDAKGALAVDVAGLFVEVARSEGFGVSVLLLEDAVRRVDAETFLGAGVELGARRRLVDLLGDAQRLLRPGSLRIVVSDFLSPHGAPELVRALSRGGGGCALVQVLSRDDVEPPRRGKHRLTDAEKDEALDLVVDDDLRERYLGRLARLVEGLRRAAQAQGGAHAERLAAVLVAEGVLMPG